MRLLSTSYAIPTWKRRGVNRAAMSAVVMWTLMEGGEQGERMCGEEEQ